MTTTSWHVAPVPGRCEDPNFASVDQNRAKSISLSPADIRENMSSLEIPDAQVGCIPELGIPLTSMSVVILVCVAAAEAMDLATAHDGFHQTGLTMPHERGTFTRQEIVCTQTSE